MKQMGIIALLLAVISYMLPWIVNPGIALSFGAYDLAEWTTLHPNAPNITDPMVTAFMLRFVFVPLIWIGVLYTASASRYRMVGVVFILVGLIAILPPPDFLSERNNVNYQQQALIFTVAFLGASMMSLRPLQRFARGLCVLFALIAIGCAWLGVINAQTLMIGFSMPVSIGLGVVGFTVLVFVAVLCYSGDQPTGRSPYDMTA